MVKMAAANEDSTVSTVHRHGGHGCMPCTDVLTYGGNGLEPKSKPGNALSCYEDTCRKSCLKGAISTRLASMRRGFCYVSSHQQLMWGSLVLLPGGKKILAYQPKNLSQGIKLNEGWQFCISTGCLGSLRREKRPGASKQTCRFTYGQQMGCS